jgi:hypothetical protein
MRADKEDMIVIMFANTLSQILSMSLFFSSSNTSFEQGRIVIDDENALIDKVENEY